MAQYTYIAADARTGQALEEIPFDNVRWGKARNSAGGFSASIASRHPKATPANLYPGKRRVYVLRNGDVVWGGFIWGARLRDGENIEIAARGTWSYFAKRRIFDTKTYTQQDQLYIARDLLNYAQARSGGSIGMVIGSETCGVLRDRSYNRWDNKPVAEAIEQLAAVDNGFDFEVVPSFNTSTGIFTDTLRLYYPQQGRVTPIDWEVGVHCLEAEWEVDADRIANFMRGLGGGDGASMISYDSPNPNLLLEYPLYDDTVSYRDVSNPNTLAGYARLWRSRRELPLIMPSIKLIPGPDTGFGSFTIGDNVGVQGTDGWTQLDGRYDIAAFNVEVSDEGAEEIGITFQNPPAMD